MSAFLERSISCGPGGCLLLLPAFVLWWLGRRAADATGAGARRSIPRCCDIAGGRRRQARGWARHDVLLVGWIVGIVAIAGPTWQREPSPFAEQSPAMIVLKVAPSMTTPDLAPTRLDRARQKIADLLKARDGMPAGLVAYSGSAHLVLPPTPDRDVVVGMAGALAPNVMPREGDRLADAVALAAKVLRDGGQGGSIVVVADTVAPGQAEALRQAAPGVPVIFYAMAPAPAVEADGNLAAAVTALDARLVPAAVDNADVQDVARRLANAPAGPTVGRGRALARGRLLADAAGRAHRAAVVPPRLGASGMTRPVSGFASGFASWFAGVAAATVVALGVATWTVGWSDLLVDAGPAVAAG